MIILRYQRIILFMTAWMVAILAGAHPGVAHPLGNFSISHYSALRLEPHRIDLHYMIDMAEIPTFQALQANDMTAMPDDPGAQAYLARQAESLKTGLHLELNGQRLTLTAVERQIIFPASRGQLHTMKLGFLYRAALKRAPMAQRYDLRFLDTNFPGRAGWKEVIAVAGANVTIEQSSVPTTDRSQNFSNYPTDLLNSPPQVLQAQVAFISRLAADRTHTVSLLPPSDQSASVPPDQDEASRSQTNETPIQLQPNQRSATPHIFSSLLTQQALSPGLTLLAFAVAIGLGAFHALEPGHGKTVVAAYLVGSRGTARHALWLGLIVTATHTAGVYVLGAITLYASQYMFPEQLYPWLSMISGLTIVGLGGYLFAQRYKSNGQAHGDEHGKPHHASTHTHDDAHTAAHVHRHVHPHQHPHAHDHAHTHTRHGHHHHYHQAEGGDSVTFRQLLALGVTGGIVPCPAALVVLLSAVALQRIGFGLLLIVAFSVGLAAILVTIGLLMVYARRFMSRFQGEGVVLTRWLPLTSAGLMTVFGLAMIAQALKSSGMLSL